MVQVDISQLSRECNSWREQLRLYRDEFNHNEAKLRQAASQPLSKDQLRLVEHLHNQFHIQLINIHDLKQSVKIHERKIQFESSGGKESSEATYAYHEDLLDQFLMLENTLQQLREDFKNFINATNC